VSGCVLHVSEGGKISGLLGKKKKSVKLSRRRSNHAVLGLAGSLAYAKESCVGGGRPSRIGEAGSASDQLRWGGKWGGFLNGTRVKKRREKKS